MVIDNSLVRPWLDRVYFEPLIKFVPRFISPNSITLSGLAACLGMIAMLAYWKTPSAAPALACGLAVHYYTLADQFDGMQARRLNRTSDLGAFLDHACDFINGQIIIWASFQLVHIDWGWLVAASSAYTIAFLSSHLEHRTSGSLHFGAVGPLEGLLFVTAFLLTYAIAPQTLTTPLFARFSAGHALIVFYLIGFGWNALSVYLRLRTTFFRVCGAPILAVCLAGAAALQPGPIAQPLWMIQLGCGSIYALRALYAPSAAIRSLPVFLIGPLSLFILVLVKTHLLAASAGAMAAYLVLGYASLALLAVLADIGRFFASGTPGPAAPQPSDS